MRQRQARRGSIFAYLVDLPTYRPTDLLTTAVRVFATYLLNLSTSPR